MKLYIFSVFREDTIKQSNTIHTVFDAHHLPSHLLVFLPAKLESSKVLFPKETVPTKISSSDFRAG
jgi:hypothetical protein